MDYERVIMLTIGGLTINQLGVVHSTNHQPRIDGNRMLEIPTTFDALGGLSQHPKTFTFRNTVHTSLNGPAGSHMLGNWDDTKYTVIAPFEEAIKLNGPPAGFNTVDTYWAFDEGVPLKLREYTVIQPGEGSFEENGFFEKNGNTISYKTNFTGDDKLRFLQEFLIKQSETPYEKDIAAKEVNKFLWECRNAGDLNALPRDFWIENVEDIEAFEKFVLGASKEDSDLIEGKMIKKIKEEAIKYGLELYGCPSRTCGANYWICPDGERVSGSDEFAKSIASSWTIHAHSAEHKLETLINGQGLFSFGKRALPDEIHTLLETHEEELTPQTLSLVQKIIESDVYRQACEFRKNLLERPMMGHNGGPVLEMAF